MTQAIFAICSLRPDGYHYFLGDFDDVSYEPGYFPGEWVIKTRERHYHVVNFACQLTLKELLSMQKLRFCDPDYIKTTKKHGFAQLTLRGEIIHKGVFPRQKLSLVKYRV